MDELKIFENPEFGSVRTITENGKTLFCGSDVAKALGYKEPHKAISRHCKGGTKRPIPTNGGIQEMVLIPEGDIYRLAARSELPGADKFESWIFDEVLPSIRKHGLYAIDEVLQNPDILIAALTELKAEREKAKALQNTVAIQTQQIAEMEPKASYYDIVLKCKDLITVSVIAKDYGKSARWLNHYLHEKGVQFKQGGVWLLYQKYADCGYTKTKTHVYEDIKGENHTAVHTYFTQSGRLFIYDLLKSDGILPLIEQE